MSFKPLRIATRKSPLAVAQAHWVRIELAKAHQVPLDQLESHFPLVTFVTRGDRMLGQKLSDVGGKGLFTKEIEAALYNDLADIAVHSMKDMPSEMPDGLVQAAVPVREDPRDSFVSKRSVKLHEMPKGARIGTSSVRRAAQLYQIRPDLRIVPLRGNVGTRLQKLKNDEADGTFLAEAGIKRLDEDIPDRQIMEVDQMLPAAGQGTLCIQANEGDDETLERCAAINCLETELRNCAERGFLENLDGSCRTPLAAHAVLLDDRLAIVGEILSTDGRHGVRDAATITLSASIEEQKKHARELGVQLSEKLRDQAGPWIDSALKPVS